jgi:anti-sigma28 factor (negative regulator of flagellin synthesis)
MENFPIGEGTRALHLSQIQEQVVRGEYSVDTHAVADAIIRRFLQGTVTPRPKPPTAS